jgi:hypothetical protein
MERNGKDNPAANHHSRMEGIPDDLESINEYFSIEYVLLVEVKNHGMPISLTFLYDGTFLPPDMTYHRRKKLFQ